MGAGVGPQKPFATSHTPTSHPTLNAEQSLAEPPPHCPDAHVFLVLQRGPVSTHGASSLLGSAVAAHFRLERVPVQARAAA